MLRTNIPDVLEKGHLGFLPPLGLMYLAAYLKKYLEHQVEIFDTQVERTDYKDIERIIKDKSPDILGITTMTFTLIDALEVARITKGINEKIKVVLGGPHVHIFPEETIRKKEVDYIVLGEGEASFKELIENIVDKEALYRVKGIVFKDNGRIVNTGLRDLIRDLDEIPFPARDLTPYQKYYYLPLTKGRIATTMITSRGCPYRCLFCDRPHLGKIFRARSAKNVVDEMQACKEIGIDEIIIYDDTFNVNRERVLEICDEIIKRGLRISWSIRARVDIIDKEMVIKMEKAGCARIHYGVEAGTQKILNVLKKDITLEEVEKAFKLTRGVGIQTLAYFMIGAPEEKREDIIQTIRFAKRIKPDFAQFSILTPFPVTGIYKKGLEEKVFITDCWRDFANSPTSDFVPKLWEKELSRDELIHLLRKAYYSFYLRPSYILGRLMKIKSFFELKRNIQIALNIL